MAMVVDPVGARYRRLKTTVITAARLMAQDVGRGGYRVRPWMVTLTYRPGDEWAPRQITQAVDAARQYFRRRGVMWRSVWVAEMQQRGAVHYHVLVWLPVGLSMPKWDKRGWWRWGFTRTERVRNAVGYAAKYVSKGGDVGFPKGCRTYGVNGLSASARRIAAWWKLPTWVRAEYGSDAVKRDASGGVRWHGIRLVSPYGVRVLRVDGKSVVVVERRADEHGWIRPPASRMDWMVVPASGEIRLTRPEGHGREWSARDEYEYRQAQAGWEQSKWHAGADYPERLRFWIARGAEV